jgi:hypothetical protein
LPGYLAAPEGVKNERPERFWDQIEEQFIYSTRKKTLGPLIRKFWDLPGEVKQPMMKEI